MESHGAEIIWAFHVSFLYLAVIYSIDIQAILIYYLHCTCKADVSSLRIYL